MNLVDQPVRRRSHPPAEPVAAMPEAFPRTRCEVLGVPIDVVSRTEAIERIMTWGSRRESRVVAICNVHSVVTATRDEAFHRVLEAADLATPDGMPVAWMLRACGHEGQQRVDGPDLMGSLCAEAARRGDGIFLYGSTPETLERLVQRLGAAFPGLRIAGTWSPPFRALTEQEDEADVHRINASGAQLVFVGLGCPRQEAWMEAHRDRVRAVMLGVGAAFDFHAGTLKRAPVWMRNAGLEWLYRLASEPRRLFVRYLTTNTAFVLGAARQLLAARRRRS